MDLYEISLRGWTSGAGYSNTYSVVADNMAEAIDKVTKKMKDENKLDDVKIEKIKLIKSGIIV
jgi:hypothetical protein